jgi:hypothetical protein
MRKAHICLIIFGVNILLIGLIFTHAAVYRNHGDAVAASYATYVRNLDLTDLCLFTEARYTRHLSQADLHSALQDHPVSLEHFPAGTLAGPPAALRRINVRLD